MAHTWDPDRYLTYADERGRPFVELIQRIGADAPATVVDLGCGPGNLTRLLAERWPDADVRGIDSSPEMIDEGPGDGARDRLRGRRPARLGRGRRPGRRPRLQRHPPVGPGPPRAAAAAGRAGPARAAGSRSRCPATSTSRATRIRSDLAAEERVRRAHRRRRRPRQPRPGRLPRRARRRRLHGRRLGDDVPPPADRRRPGLHLGVGHRRPADPAGAAGRAARRSSRRSSRRGCARRTRSTTTASCCRSAGSSWSRRSAGMRLHHVQVACPPGGEDGARRFYGDGLGLTEVEKPEDLRARGGCWFRAYGDGGAVLAEIHVGVEDPFVPARKAHPALLLADVAELEATGARLAGARLRRRLEPARQLPGPRALPHLRRARKPGRDPGAGLTPSRHAPRPAHRRRPPPAR